MHMYIVTIHTYKWNYGEYIYIYLTGKHKYMLKMFKVVFGNFVQY